jgi:hypothetical protein
MPSTEQIVGEIPGYEPDEIFDVVVETDADNTVPKYVYVRNRDGAKLVTSFYFGRPHLNCPLARAAAIVAGSNGQCASVKLETVTENMGEVIDWEDTLSLRNGGHPPGPHQLV